MVAQDFEVFHGSKRVGEGGNERTSGSKTSKKNTERERVGDREGAYSPSPSSLKRKIQTNTMTKHGREQPEGGFVDLSSPDKHPPGTKAEEARSPDTDRLCWKEMKTMVYTVKPGVALIAKHHQRVQCESHI